MAAQRTTSHGVTGVDSAVLAVPASAAALQSDVDSVLTELGGAGISASTGSVTVSHKPTINSNNGG
jgi:hypothetical protein